MKNMNLTKKYTLAFFLELKNSYNRKKLYYIEN